MPEFPRISGPNRAQAAGLELQGCLTKGSLVFVFGEPQICNIAHFRGSNHQWRVLLGTF